MPPRLVSDMTEEELAGYRNWMEGYREGVIIDRETGRKWRWPDGAGRMVLNEEEEENED